LGAFRFTAAGARPWIRVSASAPADNGGEA
jgi:hypothetical protein